MNLLISVAIMPVRLNRYASTSELSEQDNIDLQKLYADYPVSFDQAKFEQVINAEGAELFAGRFNDRLIAAILVVKTSDVVHLKYFCVRAVTRDRRVASDLLRESLKVLKQECAGSKLLLESCVENNQALEAVLNPQGFELSGQKFIVSL